MAHHCTYRGTLQGTLTGTILYPCLSARPTVRCVHLPLSCALSCEDHATRTPPSLFLASAYISFLSVFICSPIWIPLFRRERHAPKYCFFFSIAFDVHGICDAISAACLPWWRARASSCILVSKERNASPNLTVRLSQSPPWWKFWWPTYDTYHKNSIIPTIEGHIRNWCSWVSQPNGTRLS